MFGQASYYCCTHGYSSSALVAAAGPALRRAIPHWRGRLVTVTFKGHSIQVRLVDWCGCRPSGVKRIIDLHPGAFGSLRDLSYGVMKVKVSW